MSEIIRPIFIIGTGRCGSTIFHRTLAQHPAVAECQVLGVPDARLGDAPFAFVRFHPDTRAEADELIAFCAARLANYKVPRYVRAIASFPLLASGLAESRTEGAKK